jgi:hypothetical protein
VVARASRIHEAIRDLAGQTGYRPACQVVKLLDTGLLVRWCNCGLVHLCNQKRRGWVGKTSLPSSKCLSKCLWGIGSAMVRMKGMALGVRVTGWVIADNLVL